MEEGMGCLDCEDCSNCVSDVCVSSAEVDIYECCRCSSPDHDVVVAYDKSEPEYGLTFGMTLPQHHGFFKRIVLGVQYILGYKKQYSHYDEVILNKHNAEKLKQFIEKYLEASSDQDSSPLYQKEEH